MNHEEKAQALFLEGCNCAQAVFAAFCDVTGFSRQEAMRLASSFGGGVGRMREICGALSGAFLAMGWLYGYEEPGDDGEKAAHYARVQELAAAFRERHGAIQCRELLNHPDTGATPTPRTETFYRDRPCAKLVRDAAALLERDMESYPREWGAKENKN